MTLNDKAAPPFDMATLSADMRERFGWSNNDLNQVMAHLVPAALSGFRYFGFPLSGMPDGFHEPTASSAAAINPFQAYASLFQTPTQRSLTPFFGPEAVQRMLAAQISSVTGVGSDAVQEMMPVAATLAFGQLSRPFLQGEARNLLDAYMRGFARGRPKPQPTAVDYLQGYANAMTAFWGAFLRPASPAQTGPEELEAGPDQDLPVDPEEADADEAETDAAETGTSEFDEMVSGWLAAGRDFQSSQFKAFDSFFERAAKDLGK